MAADLEPGARVLVHYDDRFSYVGTVAGVDARSIVGNLPLYRVQLDNGVALSYVGSRYLREEP